MAWNDLRKKLKEEKKNDGQDSYLAAVREAFGGSDLAKSQVQNVLRYTGLGSQQTKNVANTLTSGAMSRLKSGDVVNWNRDVARQGAKDAAAYRQYLSGQGTFDSQEYAVNPAYKTLPSSDYLKQLEEMLQMQRASSLVKDDHHRAATEKAMQDAAQQKIDVTELRGAYNDMAARGVFQNGNYTEDDLLYIDSIVNGTPRRSVEDFNALPDDEWVSEYERMEQVAAGVDWDALLNPAAVEAPEVYESQTPTYDAYLEVVNGEIQRRKEKEFFESLANAKDFAQYSTYTDPTPEVYTDNAETMYDLINAQVGEAGTQALLTMAQNENLLTRLNLSFSDNWQMVNIYREQGYDMMTDDEVRLYTYLYNNPAYGAEIAGDYLKSIAPELTMRRREVESSLESAAATSGATAVGSWVAARAADIANLVYLPTQIAANLQGENDPNAAYYDAVNTKSTIHAAQEEALGEIEALNGFKIGGKNVLQHLYNIGSTTADTGLGLAIDLATGGAGKVNMALMGAKSFSGGLQESATRGISGGEALLRGGVSAFMEAIGEKLGAGPDALTGGGKKLIQNMIGEGAEEVVSNLGTTAGDEVISEIFGSQSAFDAEAQNLRLQGDKNPEATAIKNKLGELATDFVYGAAAGGLVSIPGAAAEYSENRAAGKAVSTEGDVQAVVDLAKEMDPSTASYKLAQEISARQGKNKKVTLAQLGRLTRQLEADLGSEQSKVTNQVTEDAIAQRLVELGTDVETAKKNAPAIRKVAWGQDPSTLERAVTKWDDNASQVVREMARQESPVSEEAAVKNAAAPEGQRTGQAWKSDLVTEAIGRSKDVLSRRVRLAEAVSTPVAQDAQQAAEKASKKITEKNRLNRNVTVKEVGFATADGEHKGEFLRFEKQGSAMKAVVEVDGKESVVAVEDMTDLGGAGTAAIIEYTSEAHHDISADEANTMMTTYQKTGGDVKRFITNFEAVYAAGFAGVDAPTTSLPKELATAVYEQAKQEGEKAEAERVTKAKRLRESTKGSVAWLGLVEDNTAIRGAGDQEALSEAMTGMTESQRSTVEVVQALAEELRVNVVLYESTGKNIDKTANGKYNSGTHTLYIDINSGAASSEGIKQGKATNTLGYAMMRTMGHELTHHIEATSAEGYAQYKTAVKKQLQENGQSWAELVRKKIEASVVEGRKLTRMGAEAEVVADASEYMLQESSFTKKLDSGLYAKVKTFVQSFMEKVREIFTHITGEHRESAALRRVIDGVKQYTGNLQQLWDAALGETIQDESALGAEAGDAAEAVEELEPVEQFSMGRDVEVRTDGLMAVHNIKGPELESTLKLGGFPMPSIAIIKAKEGHTMYGEYSVIFGKQTIDPQASVKNRVYGADAWTPVFPQTETEILDDVMYEREQEAIQLASQVDEEYGKKARAWYSRFSGSDATTETMDNLQNSAWNNDGMLAAYMTDHGKTVQILEKDVEVNRGYNPARADMYNHLLDIVDLADLVDMKARELIDKYGDQLAAEIPRPFARLNANWKQGDMQAGVRMVEIFKQATAYEGSGRDASIKTEKAKDYYATGDAMRSSIDRADFNEWIKEKLQGAFGMQGIYNGKERFTPSGNRRSFKQLHDEVTAANVVKAMASQEESNIPATDAAGLMAAASSMYKSIAEIKADAGRLGKISDEEYNARIAKANNAHHDLLNEIEAWDYTQIEQVGELLVQAAKKRMDANSIAAMLKRNGYKATQKAGKLAADLINQVQTIPSGYFEAKPARVVGFDEIKMIIAPDSMPAELATQLDKLGIPYTTYDGTEADRLEKSNEVEDAQFSSRAEDQLEEDKYYKGLIDKWDGTASGGRFKVGTIKKNSIYERIGLPATSLYFDHSKAAKALEKHGDHITKTTLKMIPEILANPVVITEPTRQQLKNTISVFGEMQTDNGTPIMVGIMMRPDRSGTTLLNVVRTVELRRDAKNLINDDSILYISGNKKRTADWFQGLGIQVPFAGTKSGFIRSISYSGENVNREKQEQYSSRDLPDTVSIRDADVSYDALVSKPDMILPVLTDSIGARDRKAIASAGYKNAVDVGKPGISGMPSVYVEDIGRDVHVSKKSLEHGLDRRTDQMSAAIQHAGELLQNAILINTASPKLNTANGSYILLSAGRNQDGTITPVSFVVNRFTNELEEFDVLKSMKTKKNQSRITAGIGANALLPTDSTISIAELVDLVKEDFTDMWSNDVIARLGLQRKATEITSYLQYSTRDLPETTSARQFIAESGDEVASTLEEKNALQIYRKKLEAYKAAVEEVENAEKARDAVGAEKSHDAGKSAKAQNVVQIKRMNQEKAYNDLIRAEDTPHVRQVLDFAREFINEASQGTVEDFESRKAEAERQLAEMEAQYEELLAAGRTQMAAEQKKRLELQQRYARTFKTKVAEGIKTRRAEYEEREQRARAYRQTREEVNKLRRGIGRTVKYLNTRRAHESDQRHIPHEMTKIVDYILAEFTDEKLARLSFSAKQAANLNSLYNKLKTYDTDNTYFWDDEVEEKLRYIHDLAEEYHNLMYDESGKRKPPSLEGYKHERELLTNIEDVIENIRRMVDAENEIFLDEKDDTFKEYSTNTAKALLERKDAHLLRGALGDAQKIANELLWTGNMTPVYFFERLQNDGLLTAFNAVRDGQRKYGRILNEAKKFVLDSKKRHHYDRWVGDGLLIFKTVQGHKITLTREQALWAYATAKREESLELKKTEHLSTGGFHFRKAREDMGTKGLFRDTDKAHQLQAADIQTINNWLTAEQKAYADELVEYLSTTMGDYGNEASLRMYGYKKFREKYYFPFRTWSAQNFQRGDEGSSDTGEANRIKSAGFTKNLTHKANTALEMSDFTDVIGDHIQAMTTYATMVAPVEDVKRLMNHKVADADGTQSTIRALIGQKYGLASQNYVTDFLRDLNGAVQTDNRAGGGIEKLISTFKRGAVAGSLSVVVQQPTAIFRAMALVSPKYFRMNRETKNDGKLWEEMLRYSGAAVVKDAGKFDIGLGHSAADWVTGQDIMNPAKAFMRMRKQSVTKAGKEGFDVFKEWLTFLPGFADQVTWQTVWKAVKNEQHALHPELDTSSEAFLELCGKRFDDVMDHTQVYDSVLVKSNLMRSKNQFHKMATSFMSEPTLTLNIMIDALKGKHGLKQGSKMFAAAAVSQVAAGTLAALVQAWNDDDDERNAKEKLLDRTLYNIAGNLNPIEMLPYLSNIWDTIEGFTVQRSDMEVINDLVTYTKQVANGNLSGWNMVEKLGGTIANIFGVPLGNIMRDFRRGKNAIESEWGKADRENLGFIAQENLQWFWADSKKAYYNRMVNAALNGDMEYYEEMMEYMQTSKMADKSAIKTGMRGVLKKMVQSGEMTPEEATAFLNKYASYANEKDNTKKPLEWAAEKD